MTFLRKKTLLKRLRHTNRKHVIQHDNSMFFFEKKAFIKTYSMSSIVNQ